MNRVRNAFLVLIPGFALLFIVFAAINFFFGPERGILPSFTLSWHMLAAFASACEWIIPLLSASVFLCFGLFTDKNPEGSNRARGSIAFVVATALVCAVVLLALKPLAERRSSRISEASALFMEELREGSRAHEAGEWARAAQALNVMATIAPKDKRYLDLRKKYAERPGYEAPAAPPSGAKKAERTDRSANELYIEAQEAFRAGRYYDAHSLATRASRIDPKRLDAVRLASEAWTKIGIMEDGIEERSRRDLAKRKRAAYQTLKSGDPVAAYSLFLALKEQSPGDPEIERYAQESLEEMKSVAFFMDEVGRLSRLPRSRSFFMKLPADGGTSTNFIAASSLYLGEEVAYMVDFEFISVSSGKVVKKLSAPYAKARAGRILLACYDRDNPARSWKPIYLAGGTGKTADNILDLSVQREDLELGAIAASGPESAGLPDLIKVYAKGQRVAIDPAPFLREGLLRLHALLMTLFAALFSFLLGARYRYPGSKPPYFQALVTGALSFIAASMIVRAARWAGSGLAAALAPKTGSLMEIVSAFLIFFLVHAVFISASMILIAGHRDKSAA